MAPVQIAKLYRCEIFEDLIEQLLLYCGRWLELSFYRTARIEQLCHEARVKLVYLLLYSLDLNLIEGIFAELKWLIKSTGSRLKTVQNKALICFWNSVLIW